MRIFIVSLASKRLLVSVFLLFLAGMAFGEKITVTPPTFSGNNPEIYIDAINQAAKEAFGDLQNSLNDFLPDNFNNLAGGFANASVFSSDGASQRGYEGYNAFSFTFGFMGALKLPELKYINTITNAINSNEGEIGTDLLKDIVNIPFGLDLQVINAQLGINTSKFLLKGLYLGFKFSKFDTDWIKGLPFSDFSFKTMSMGVNASYQLISQKRLLGGLLVWRGLNLGTGFIWQNTSLDITPALPIDDEILIPIKELELEIGMPINGLLHMGFETNTYIVPIKAMTSLRLAWFLNLTLGVGVDIAFGSSNIDISGSINVDRNKVTGLPEGVYMDTEPKLELSLGGGSRPSIINLKIMGAVGFNFGPVIIDIPVTYYFMDNGYSLGITMGLTF
jgi:hypothetical protein